MIKILTSLTLWLSMIPAINAQVKVTEKITTMLNIDSFQPNYLWSDTCNRSFTFWYNVNGDTIGKYYSYFDKGRQKMKYKGLVKDVSPPTIHIKTSYFIFVRSVGRWEYLGRQTRFHKNGNKWIEWCEENKKFEESYLEYYKNGQIKIKGAYEHNKRVGNWVKYNRKGVLILQYNYSE